MRGMMGSSEGQTLQVLKMPGELFKHSITPGPLVDEGDMSAPSLSPHPVLSLSAARHPPCQLTITITITVINLTLAPQ